MAGSDTTLWRMTGRVPQDSSQEREWRWEFAFTGPRGMTVRVPVVTHSNSIAEAEWIAWAQLPEAIRSVPAADMFD